MLSTGEIVAVVGLLITMLGAGASLLAVAFKMGGLTSELRTSLAPLKGLDSRMAAVETDVRAVKDRIVERDRTPPPVIIEAAPTARHRR